MRARMALTRPGVCSISACLMFGLFPLTLHSVGSPGRGFLSVGWKPLEFYHLKLDHKASEKSRRAWTRGKVNLRRLHTIATPPDNSPSLLPAEILTTEAITPTPFPGISAPWVQPLRSLLLRLCPPGFISCA